MLIDALVKQKEKAKMRLRTLIEELNLTLEEKLVISSMVYSDVESAAASEGLDPSEVANRITPARTVYFWLEPIENRIIQNAFTAIQSNPNLKLTLTDWTSLIWMAENEVDKIVSNRDEIDQLLNEPDEFKNIPRIVDKLRKIRRI